MHTWSISLVTDARHRWGASRATFCILSFFLHYSLIKSSTLWVWPSLDSFVTNFYFWYLGLSDGCRAKPMPHQTVTVLWSVQFCRLTVSGVCSSSLTTCPRNLRSCLHILGVVLGGCIAILGLHRSSFQELEYAYKHEGYYEEFLLVPSETWSVRRARLYSWSFSLGVKCSYSFFWTLLCMFSVGRMGRL